MIMLILLVVFVVLLALWPIWFRASVKRKRARDPHYRPANVMGVFSEIYQPDAHAASQIHEA